MLRSRTLPLILVISLCSPAAFAQDAAPQPERSDPDIPVNALQPDFNLAALPTTLRMPSGKWAFRITHRFTRALGQGDFGDLLSNAFGFDGGAQIGFELRYGLRPGTQLGVHRTSDRSIQFFGQQTLMNERAGAPVGLDAIATIEGTENLHDHYQSAIGLVLSRNAGRWAALYAEPMIVLNSSPFPEDAGDNHTVLLGLGARLRVRPSTYVLAEFSPRLAGYDPGESQVSFGVERRVGGHLFQINVSNGFGTTLGQVARGTLSDNDWYIGFNISRKFF
jgi:Membrane bound beta barrel domain (DUF5777)